MRRQPCEINGSIDESVGGVVAESLCTRWCSVVFRSARRSKTSITGSGCCSRYTRVCRPRTTARCSHSPPVSCPRCFLKPRSHDTTCCQTGCQAGCTTGFDNRSNEQCCSFNTVVKPVNRLDVCLHDTAGCQAGCTKERKERKSIYIAPFRTKVHTKRSGMDHTVLPANNTMPLSTRSAPSHGGSGPLM